VPGVIHADAPSSPLAERKHAREMQPALRARRADIDEPTKLGAVLGFGEAPQIAIDRVRLAAARLHRCEQQAARPTAPTQDFRAATVGNASKSRQDHGVEFEALGPMQCHDLDARREARVGLRMQPRERADKRGPIGHVAADIMSVDEREESLRRFEVDRFRQCGAAAECKPCAAHPGGNPGAAAGIEGSRQHRCEAREALRRLRATSSQSAPSHPSTRQSNHCTEHRQPRPRRKCPASEGRTTERARRRATRAVGRLNERVRQRLEILHRLALTQEIEIDCGKRNVRGAQHRQQRVEMSARADQDRNVLRPFASAVSTYVTIARASSFASGKTSNVTALPATAGHAAAAGTKPTTPRHGSLLRPSTDGNTRFVQATSSGSARKLRRRTRLSTGRSPMHPLACASTNSLTSAPRKR
jgi:hypothetical protein